MKATLISGGQQADADVSEVQVREDDSGRRYKFYLEGKVPWSLTRGPPYELVISDGGVAPVASLDVVYDHTQVIVPTVSGLPREVFASVNVFPPDNPIQDVVDATKDRIRHKYVDES